jgi:hypothetical protein
MTRRHALVLLATVAAATVLACAHQPDLRLYTTHADVPGFFSGIWHGLVAPIALVAGIFSDVRVYNFPNSGGWYDFGFLLGISVWGGGGGAAARR